MRRTRRHSGFTLLEVLIAISITAMIGIGATQLLSNIINTKQATDIRSEKLASLQRFNMVISRDIEQIINRTVRDAYGDAQEAILLDAGDYPLEFTRTGWRNSPVASDPRAELQRVAYRLEDIDSDICEPARLRLQSWGIAEPQGECLVRYFWNVLDRASTSEPQAQVVLEQAEDLDIELLVQESSTETATSGDVTGQNWTTSWPALNSASNSKLSPLAIRWRLTLPEIGEIERLFLLAWGDFQS
ncbi:type II secretion system minor pseudopilin GspJ [Thalassolituus sp. LLYu03]|uniref:type II secretion system minor pseudopilin GspJ n=1 Tax=Thalassolituus sp. LLYu03 TaxID=3421656 RepID=UPI003D286049